MINAELDSPRIASENDKPTFISTKLKSLTAKISAVWNNCINKLKEFMHTFSSMVSIGAENLTESISTFYSDNKRKILIFAGLNLVIFSFPVITVAPPLGFLMSGIGGSLIGYNIVRLHQEASPFQYRYI